jgi:predicted Zn finger-like uncharacterized protein
MLTRCPQCGTIYPLNTGQLKAAEGRVRCASCRCVFYGLEHLRHDESQMPDGEGPPELVSAPRLEVDIAAQAQRVSGTDTVEMPIALTRQTDRAAVGPGWWLLLLLLLLGAIGQAVWLERLTWVHNPQIAGLVQAFCAEVGCELPARRALDRILVLHREMKTLEGPVAALQFSLVVVNQAGFAQPYPLLQLELFGKDGDIAGKRIFTPGEYLQQEGQDDLLQPDQSLQMGLQLLDPGVEVHGFEIRFL